MDLYFKEIETKITHLGCAILVQDFADLLPRQLKIQEVARGILLVVRKPFKFTTLDQLLNSFSTLINYPSYTFKHHTHELNIQNVFVKPSGEYQLEVYSRTIQPGPNDKYNCFVVPPVFTFQDPRDASQSLLELVESHSFCTQCAHLSRTHLCDGCRDSREGQFAMIMDRL